MNSRTDKYYDENNVVGSRTQRNGELYKEIGKTELDNFEVKSNATVIGNNKGNIDVEKIKSILDTHYNDAPKRKSIRLEEIPEKEEPVSKTAQETKEYDINVILDKAKEGKSEDYNADRAKKLRNTQFDILNNLNINPKDYIEDYEDEKEEIKEEKEVRKSGASDDLQTLIDTIALNENDIKKEKIKIEETVTIKPAESEDDEADSENGDIDLPSISDISSEDDKEATDPLDIFSDLKGSENTTVLEGLQEKAETMIGEIQKTTDIKVSKKSEKDNENNEDTFFTKSSKFSKADFDDEESGFEDVEKGTSWGVKIMIFLLLAVFVLGIVILVKSFIS